MIVRLGALPTILPIYALAFLWRYWFLLDMIRNAYVQIYIINFAFIAPNWVRLQCKWILP